MPKLVKLHTLNVVCIILSQYSCKKKKQQKGRSKQKQGIEVYCPLMSLQSFVRTKGDTGMLCKLHRSRGRRGSL